MGQRCWCNCNKNSSAMDETLQILFCRVWIMRSRSGSKWSKSEHFLLSLTPLWHLNCNLMLNETGFLGFYFGEKSVRTTQEEKWSRTLKCFILESNFILQENLHGLCFPSHWSRTSYCNQQYYNESFWNYLNVEIIVLLLCLWAGQLHRLVKKNNF